MTRPGSDSAHEKPLGGWAKFLLVAATGLVMALAYLYIVAAILFLAALMIMEFCVAMVLARFGLMRIMTPVLGAHLQLIGVILAMFRREKFDNFEIPLQREDAPRLFELLDGLCQKLNLVFPREVMLFMGDGAWVRLGGVRTGGSKTTLGVGYDLLAGLTVAEMEAVLAHELTHAKLVRRGFANWLRRGQARLGRFAAALWGQAHAAQRREDTAHVAEAYFFLADRIAKLAARLLAAYSRQNEFEADWGAAKLCGPAAMRSALSKLESLHEATSRLPWNERVAQLQESGEYSRWLLAEIAAGAGKGQTSASQEIINHYSTHPRILDRLAALPPAEAPLPADSPTAVSLLARPDAIAHKLLYELQRLLAEREGRDSAMLEKFLRKSGRIGLRRRPAVYGLLAILGATLFAICLIMLGPARAKLWWIDAAVFAGGLIAMLPPNYRDELDLSVPDYALLLKPRQETTAASIEERQKAMQIELQQGHSGLKNAQRVRLLAAACYAALAECDYLRAHVAGRLCVNANNRSVPGALGLAIACASYGQAAVLYKNLSFIQTRTGFKTFSTAWGAAWATILAGDWARGEAFLGQAAKLRPDNATLAALLALAQWKRGKLQSAIRNSRRAAEAAGGTVEMKKFLAGRLLEAGLTREAEARLRELGASLDSDAEMVLFLAQLRLLQRRFAEADACAARIRQDPAATPLLINLGKLYEQARLREQATALYDEALARDHYPEAHLGLGRIKMDANRETARGHLLAALNLERSPGKNGAGTLQILQPVLNQMLGLREPLGLCEAWIARLPGSGHPAGLANQSFMVYAPNLQEAKLHFKEMVNAFQPGKSVPPISPQDWQRAPRPFQPLGPVRPGVQGIWR